jgi:hypothetical protein
MTAFVVPFRKALLPKRLPRSPAVISIENSSCDWSLCFLDGSLRLLFLEFIRELFNDPTGQHVCKKYHHVRMSFVAGAISAGQSLLIRVTESLPQELIGLPVTEMCDHGEHPRCRFEVRLPGVKGRAVRR